MFGGPGYGWGIWHALQAAFMAIGGLLLLIIFLGLAVLLARFLLVATRAAELYVADNRSRPSTPDAAVAPTTAAAVPAEPVGPVGSAEPPVKPAPRPRTPRTPPPAP